MATKEMFNFPQVDIRRFLDILESEFANDIEAIQRSKEPNSAEPKRRPQPYLALGVAGIGKTEGVRGLTAKLSAKLNIPIGFKEMRLCNYTETDLIGLPYLSEDKSHTEHAPNTLFPTVERDGEYGILLIDEFTSAPRNIQVPILQLTDSSRSVGQYVLPEGWKIVITGNGPNDGGTFTNLPGTVISRSACFYVSPLAEGWLNWAAENHIHPAIRAYVKYSDNALHSYLEDDESGYDRAFACPRAWANLSVALTDFYKEHPNWTRSEKSFDSYGWQCDQIVSARVGQTQGTAFLSFLQYEKQMIDPMDIIKASTKEERAVLPKLKDLDIQLRYLTISNVADKMQTFAKAAFDPTKPGVIDGKFLRASVNVFWWITETASDPRSEICIFGVTEVAHAIGGVLTSIIQNDAFKKHVPKFDVILDVAGRIYS